MSRFSLSALGADGPGIVAAVSGALGEQGCNLEDSTMTILQGQFAILLVVTAPDSTTATSLEAALGPVADRFGLVVAVRALNDGPTTAGSDVENSEALTIAVHGADRPGIVHAVAGALAERGGNVVDLSTQLVGDPERPVYVLTLRAVAPADRVDDVADAVMRTASELGVHCSVRRDDADVL
jgi:glycine cleavage system transcriptional repressor